MREPEPSGACRCGICGRVYDEGPPSFCLSCGTRLIDVPGPEVYDGVQVDRTAASSMRARTAPRPHAAYAWRSLGAGATARLREARARISTAARRNAALVAVLASVLALLIAAGVTGAVLAARGGPRVSDLPATAAEMKASIDECHGYLNSHWENLAPGKALNAPIYSVNAKLDPSGATIGGDEKVLYSNRTGVPLSEIVLRVYAGAASVKGGGPGVTVQSVKAGGTPVSAVVTGSLLRVPLAATLAPGSEVLLDITFTESIPKIKDEPLDMKRLLGDSTGGDYGVFGHGGNVFDLGYFIPTVATYGPRGWESRDVPAFGDVSCFDCAYYNVSIDVPENFVVAAPGVAACGSGAAGRKIFQFRGGPMRDFTAQASPDYQVARAREDETVISSYYLKDTAGKGKEALGFAREAVRQYNEHIGWYPYDGLNVCEAPLGGGAGGMEFAGQVQISGMLYEGISSLLGGEGVDLGTLLNSASGDLLGSILEFTIAHEVCHQWWGITLGSDSIDHPWQDESLTNYCSVLYFRWAHGEEAARSQLETQIKMQYTVGRLMGLGSDEVVDTPADGFANSLQYSTLVYCKGALFFEALENLIGREAFEKSIKRYYDYYAFGTATPSDLMASFQTNSDGESIAALHRHWILESHDDGDSDAGVADMLDELLKNLPGDLNTNNLQDLLKNLLPDGTMPELPDLFQDGNEPVLPI